MSDLKTSIILDLTGNMERQAKRFESGLGRLGTRGSASMRLLSGSVALAGKGLDRLGNRYTGLITGAAGIGSARMVANLGERFERLGIQADADSAAMIRLKREIYEVARSPEIRVDPGQILGAIEEIVEKTGDLKFAVASIRNIGLALQATGGDGAAIGGILAEFQKMGLDPTQSFEALDILNVQGKAGAFTLANLAALGPRVVTAYTAMGRTGVPAIREMGAALQVIRQGTGSSEMAATAFEALLRTLGEADKLKVLQAGGIQVFEPGSLTVMRALPDIMEDIVKKTGGSKVALSKVFDAEAIRAFNAAAGEFQRTGKVESLKKFYAVQADGSTITRDSARAAGTANAALQSLSTSWQKFADSELSGPIQKLADGLNSLEPGTVDRWLKIGTGLVATVGGLIVAGKVAGAVRSLRSGFGGAVSTAAAGGLGPTHVIVDNVVNVNDYFGSRGAGAAATPYKASPLLAASPLIPAVGAAIVGATSIAVGEAIARSQAKNFTTPRLKELLSQQMVMGGGSKSFQVKTIEQELAERGELKGTLRVEIETKNGQNVARVRELTSSKNFDLNVNTGLNTVGR